MNIDRAIFAMAGTMVLVSLLLAHFVSPMWLWLTAFVGANGIKAAADIRDNIATGPVCS